MTTMNPPMDQPMNPDPAMNDDPLDDTSPMYTPAGDVPGEMLEETLAVPAQTGAIVVSVEFLVYAVLLIFSIALRLAELGTIPLTDREAFEALAVFRAIEPRAVGLPLVSNNPLMFAVNAIIMSMTGSETVSARIATALIGVLIVLSPLLFRRWIGQGRAVIMTVLFAISPVLLLSSRSMSGSVWSAALVIGLIFTTAKFMETRRALYAIAATTMGLMLLVASEAAGFLMLLGLLIGLIFALFTTDDPLHYYRHALRQTLRDWPWLRALLLAAVFTAFVVMVFMVYPAGLSGIGSVLSGALRGFVERPAGYPFAFPLLSSLLYEPVLWIFGFAGAYLILREEATSLNFVYRILVGWLIASILFALLYPGAEPSHALWLTLPLLGLSAVAIERAFSPVRDSFWHVPSWGQWLHGLAFAAVLAIVCINLLAVGRMMMSTSPANLPTLDKPMQLVMVAPATMLAVITFFLIGSMWGAKAAWRGVGIGLVALLSVYSLGSGWRGAVINGDNPVEFWQIHPAARNLNLLNNTLIIASRRSSGAPYDADIAVQVPTGSDFEDGALGWALHKYFHTTYVTDLGPTINQALVIAPKTDTPPTLGQGYVGQDFPVYNTWDRSSLSWDFITWLYERDTRVPATPDQPIILWVRADVYGVGTGTDAPPSVPQTAVQ